MAMPSVFLQVRQRTPSSVKGIVVAVFERNQLPSSFWTLCLKNKTASGLLVSHSDRMNKESYRTVTRPAGLRAKCDKVPSNGGLNLKDVKVISNRLPHSITLAIDVMAMGVHINSDVGPHQNKD